MMAEPATPILGSHHFDFERASSSSTMNAEPITSSLVSNQEPSRAPSNVATAASSRAQVQQEAVIGERVIKSIRLSDASTEATTRIHHNFHGEQEEFLVPAEKPQKGVRKSATHFTRGTERISQTGINDSLLQAAKQCDNMEEEPQLQITKDNAEQPFLSLPAGTTTGTMSTCSTELHDSSTQQSYDNSHQAAAVALLKREDIVNVNNNTETTIISTSPTLDSVLQKNGTKHFESQASNDATTITTSAVSNSALIVTATPTPATQELIETHFSISSSSSNNNHGPPLDPQRERKSAPASLLMSDSSDDDLADDDDDDYDPFNNNNDPPERHSAPASLMTIAADSAYHSHLSDSLTSIHEDSSERFGLQQDNHNNNNSHHEVKEEEVEEEDDRKPAAIDYCQNSTAITLPPPPPPPPPPSSSSPYGFLERKPSLRSSRSPRSNSSPKQHVHFATAPAPEAVATAVLPTLDHGSGGKMENYRPSNNQNSAARTRRIQSRCEPPAGNDHDDDDDVPKRNSTSDIPTPRGRRGIGLGLRGATRRTASGDSTIPTSADRELRRQQIRDRAAAHSPGRRRTARSTSPVPTRAAIREPSSAGGTIPRTRSSDDMPIALLSNSRTTTTPLSAAAAAAAPGDNLATAARAPGDNLASLTAAQRPITVTTRIVPRSRPVAPQLGKQQQNLGVDAYEAIPATPAGAAAAADAGHSLKQRLRRQNQDPNTPSAIRPGAYKEIPGRGLIRNETLRFNIMNTIQRQKASIKRMFSSRRGGLAADRSESHDNNGNAMNDTSNKSDGNRTHVRGSNRWSSSFRGSSSRHDVSATSSTARASLRASARKTVSLRSIGSIPSVLVEDEEDDKRSYLGNISFRSLTDAEQQGGLSVARPVFVREPSTLEALCIIPGDLAVAVALDNQIREHEHRSQVARLEALSTSNRNLTANRNLKPPPVYPPAIAEAATLSSTAVTSGSNHGKRTKKRSKVSVIMSKFNPKKLPQTVQRIPQKLTPKNVSQAFNPKNIFRRHKKPKRTKSSAVPGCLRDSQSIGTLRTLGGLHVGRAAGNDGDDVCNTIYESTRRHSF